MKHDMTTKASYHLTLDEYALAFIKKTMDYKAGAGR